MTKRRRPDGASIDLVEGTNGQVGEPKRRREPEQQQAVSCPRSTPVKEILMDKEHIKGAAEKVQGAIKDTVGHLTGNEKLQAEGKADKAAGTARETAGDVKDAGRNVADAFKR